MAAVSAARSLVTGEIALLATAFAAGGLSSLWFVSVAPAVSALTSGAKRTLGFSLFFSAGITTGVLGGVAGGRLPAWLDGFLNTGSPARAKQAALLAGCAIMAMAALPALRLALPGAPPHQSRAYPWSPFLGRLLGALAVWSFAVGVFNPFFTAYFARLLQASETRIGLVFSISQLAQAAAVLLAPLALRRFGLVGGIAGMQLAAALALACLAGGPPLLGAAALYAGYMSFQSMCEPGTYTLLMNGVAPEQRSGATAMNFLVIFGTQAVAAHVSGALIARLGYPAMLIAAAGMAVLAAAMFRLWVRPPGPEQTQTTR
jgi:hypothetical protein